MKIEQIIITSNDFDEINRQNLFNNKRVYKLGI
jgi:hypothetical protein